MIYPKEADEQATVIRWAKMHQNVYKYLHLLHGSLNGVKLTKGQAVKAKAQGLIRGVPDLCLPVPINGHRGLYIELKRHRKTYPKVSPEQEKFLAELSGLGYFCAVCYGAQEAIDCIKHYYSLGEVESVST